MKIDEKTYLKCCCSLNLSKIGLVENVDLN